MPKGAIISGALLLIMAEVVMAGESAVVIASPDTGLHGISRETVRAIFAMRQRTLPDDRGAVHVFVLPDQHPLHERFVKEILHVYPHQLRLSWDRLVFSGTGQSPNEVSSPAEMRRRVASTPGGIGYLNRGSTDESVITVPVE